MVSDEIEQFENINGESETVIEGHTLAKGKSRRKKNEKTIQNNTEKPKDRTTRTSQKPW